MLFSKLLRLGIHPLIVRLLYAWYTTQTFSVKWGNIVSSSFTVRSGTCQGGILSPVLFNVYIDDEWSETLQNIDIGCYINNVYLNHLIYTDDTVLIAPSATALQQLLNICQDFVKENDLELNLSKSKYMVFKTDILWKGYDVQMYKSTLTKL